MSVIVKLPDEVVNKIAAGEVVQRPSSALKELLENSIDAGATKITVTCRDGGLGLLQITDDGHGIDPSDFPLLCERFATSKLRTFDDLLSIETFGFRGEALSSISQVSRLSVISQKRDAAHGHSARFLDGKMVDGPSICAAQPGTVIRVEDLFYNVGVRRRTFEKGGNVEYAKIVDVVSKYALAFPHVGFGCKKEGAKKHDVLFPSKSSLLSNVGISFGTSLSAKLHPFELTHEDATTKFSFTGVASDLSLASKRTTLTVFINNRLVEASAVRRAVDQAYAPVLVGGAKPFVAVFLRVQPNRVDVNVHPTKHEVYLLDEDLIASKLHDCIKDVVSSVGGIGTTSTQKRPGGGSGGLTTAPPPSQGGFAYGSGSKPTVAPSTLDRSETQRGDMLKWAKPVDRFALVNTAANDSDATPNRTGGSSTTGGATGSRMTQDDPAPSPQAGNGVTPIRPPIFATQSRPQESGQKLPNGATPAEAIELDEGESSGDDVVEVVQEGNKTADGDDCDASSSSTSGDDSQSEHSEDSTSSVEEDDDKASDMIVQQAPPLGQVPQVAGVQQSPPRSSGPSGRFGAPVENRELARQALQMKDLPPPPQVQHQQQPPQPQVHQQQQPTSEVPPAPPVAAAVSMSSMLPPMLDSEEEDASEPEDDMMLEFKRARAEQQQQHQEVKPALVPSTATTADTSGGLPQPKTPAAALVPPPRSHTASNGNASDFQATPAAVMNAAMEAVAANENDPRDQQQEAPVEQPQQSLADIQLESIRQLFQGWRRDGSDAVTDTVRRMVYVGVVNQHLFLAQSGTTLLLCDMKRLAQRAAMQHVLLRWGHQRAVRLDPPINVLGAITAAVRSSVPDSDSTLKKLGVENVARRAARRLLQWQEMLKLYCCLNFELSDEFHLLEEPDKADQAEYLQLTSVPLPLGDHWPPLVSALPEFLLRLSTVDFTAESKCFLGIAEAVGRLFQVPGIPELRDMPTTQLVPSAEEGTTNNKKRARGADAAKRPQEEEWLHTALAEPPDSLKNAIRFGLLPALTANAFTPIADLASDGSLRSLVTVEALYRVFERC